MAASVFVVLVGIDRYPYAPLNGCVNDISGVEKMLHAVIPAGLHILKLLDQQATRAALIRSFDFFDQAKEGDQCLFYYCGHGSFIKAPREFWTETDGFNETLVCYDSRLPGGMDLIDKELAYILWQKFQQRPFLTPLLITDCCHSGSLTRFAGEAVPVIRAMEQRFYPAAYDQYYGYGKADGGYITEALATGGVRVSVREQAHIHIGACRDNQTSKELLLEGKTRGAFTSSLLKILYLVNGGISLQDLTRQISLQLQSLVKDQDPSLNLNGRLPAESGKLPFLNISGGSPAVPHASFRPAYGWCLDIGALQGISKGDSVEIKGCGFSAVSSAGADFALLENGPSLNGLDKKKVYDAAVTRQANQPLLLQLELENAQVELVKQAMAGHSYRFLSLTEGPGDLKLCRSAGDSILLVNEGKELPMIEAVPVTTPSTASLLLDLAESVGSWLHLRDLENRSTLIPGNQFSLTIVSETGSVAGGQPADLHYRFLGGQWTPQSISIVFNNLTGRELWVSTAYLGFDYSISANAIKKERVPPYAEIKLKAVVSSAGAVSDHIPVLLGDELYDKGYSEITEYLKFFISEAETDLNPLEQAGFNLATKRMIGFDPGSKTIGAPAWTTLTTALHIIRPQAEAQVLPGRTTFLPTFELAGHPALSAKVSVNSSRETFRSADAVPPPSFKDAALEPYNLQGNTRGSAFDVLELFEVSDPSAVNENEPLVLRFPENFSRQECVLALGYDPDSQVYYPLGFSQGKEIRISHLPAVSASDSLITKRSFTGSIKLYFQKIVSAQFGIKFNYPLLREVKVDKNLAVTYSDDLSGIKDKKQLYLYIHGIIGDTLDMVKSARLIRNPQGIILADDPETAILAFDYENLNTTIQDNAAFLKQRLLDAGFTAGGDQELVIIAHSMGGLVSRWFIEQLGGDQLVDHLFMFGTPNNGTAWANVRDYASTLLTYAINGSVMLKPWTLPIAGLIKKIAGGTQVAFEQMNARTGIYATLNSGRDPGIPYSIVAGNTQEIDPLDLKTSGFLAALLKRTKEHLVYELLDVLLFKQPNDIAVSTDSISQIPKTENWRQKPEVRVVASDHLNYFKHLEQL